MNATTTTDTATLGARRAAWRQLWHELLTRETEARPSGPPLPGEGIEASEQQTFLRLPSAQGGETQ